MFDAVRFVSEIVKTICWVLKAEKIRLYWIYHGQPMSPSHNLEANKQANFRKVIGYPQDLHEQNSSSKAQPQAGSH